MIFTRARSRFLRDLLLLSGLKEDPQVLESMTIKALEVMVNEHVATTIENTDCSFGDSMKMQYAAAYMVVAHKKEIKRLKQQQQQHKITAVSGHIAPASASAPGDSVATGDGGWSESDLDGWSEADEADVEEDEVDDERVAGGQQGQKGPNKQQEVQRLVRLCFQWVVAEELQELAWAL